MQFVPAYLRGDAATNLLACLPALGTEQDARTSHTTHASFRSAGRRGLSEGIAGVVWTFVQPEEGCNGVPFLQKRMQLGVQGDEDIRGAGCSAQRWCPRPSAMRCASSPVYLNAGGSHKPHRGGSAGGPDNFTEGKMQEL